MKVPLGPRRLHCEYLVISTDANAGYQTIVCRSSAGTARMRICFVWKKIFVSIPAVRMKMRVRTGPMKVIRVELPCQQMPDFFFQRLKMYYVAIECY